MSTAAKSFYDLEADLPKGDKLSMAQLKGKVVIIVNVASKCGFTPQYTGLEELYKKYHDQGLEIIGFPCNQVKPGSDEAIATFCSATYPVTFPIAKKSNVNGNDANEVFKWLKEQKEGKGLLTNAIKWNFTKFLCSKQGEVIKRYGPSTTPADIEEDVKKALAA
ncbi:glutathione peroxidase [Cystobasidium minutum MCA 4210]|uniref:glutathione peroxidase n=1 Tax=Cystobasidium minutum MCA 4210 TaxID=1397322 RepID=UPI0034D01EE8|eukprot:jgi/Rhomi1/146413/e_gw1.6.358.1